MVPMSRAALSNPLAKLVPTLVVVLLAAPALAGCLAADPDDDLTPAADPPVLTYQAVDELALSEPVYEIVDAVDTYVAATTDGINLFAEYYLPDGDGPWPTILHSTPYKHLDKAFSTAFYAASTVQGETGKTGNGLVDFYVPRGYAVVLADVRGFGDSEGCVEVWGLNEQQDQYDLVEWAASQEWSDGKVGMIGASYPGTTPIEAAVLAPPSLVTIVAAAGLTDPYFDWHFGGVPTGESGPIGSPAAYQAIGAAAPIEPTADPLAWAQTAANTGCGLAELFGDAYQTDSVYTQFYKDRNLAANVKSIEASVLYTQGFLDGNVKPTQMLDFFNEIEAPKKGFFGQWGHQFPARSDYKVYEHAWFDHWLQGSDTGVMNGPVAEVLTNDETWRGDTQFPTQSATTSALYLDASDLALSFDMPTQDASADVIFDRRPTMAFGPASGAEDMVRGHDREDESITFASSKLDLDVYLSGVMHLNMTATMDAENAYFMAALYEVQDDGRTRIAFGGLAAALRDGFETYVPVPVGEDVDYRFRFQPREYIADAGSTLELVIYTVDLGGATTDEAIGPTTVTIKTGPTTPTHMELPVLDGRPDSEYPWPSE